MPESATWGKILEGVEETAPTSFEDLPEGNYKARLESGELTTSRADVPGLNLKFRIIEGPHANRVVYTTYWIKEESAPAMKVFMQNVAALGADRQWLITANPSNEQVIARIVNQNADIRITHNRNADSGKLYYNVWVNKGHGQDQAPSAAGPGSSLPSGPALPTGPSLPTAVVNDPWAAVPEAPVQTVSSPVVLPPGSSPF